MTTTPTPPTTPQGAPPAEDAFEGPGLFTSMGILLLTLGAIRLALPLVDESYHTKGIAAVFTIFLFTRYLRSALFKGILGAIVCSGAIVCVRDRSLPEFSVAGLGAFGRSTLQMTTGWGAGKQLAQIVAWKRQSHARIIEGATADANAAASNRWRASPELYRPYVDGIEGRNPTIRAKAIELTRGCSDDDEICEVAQINRFVSTRITYRKDPRGQTDFVQKATETLEAGAGDCEDQSILLASLLEAVGKRSLLAFTSDHAYPVVCFDKRFDQHIKSAMARAYTDASYRSALLETGGWPSGSQAVQSFVIDGATCFPLEPTDANAYVGYPHDEAEIEALVDPVEHQYVRFSSERTTGLRGS